jgi:Calcineurin-like phosphoesterase
MKRFLAALTLTALFGLVVITVLGGVAFGTIVGSRLQAENMTESSGSISVQSDPDGSGPAGSNLRWASGATVSARARQSITVPAGSAVHQIQLFTRQPLANTAVFAIYVDGTSIANRVGTFRPPAGSAWGTSTVNLSTAIQPGVHTLYIGPNATFSNNAFIDWFELHNTGSTPPPGGDTTAPETTITSGPSGSVTGTAATFEFTSDEPGSTFGCQLLPLESAPTSCTSPKSYSGLAAGTEYTFSVRATDASGNTDATPATRSFTPSGDPPPPTTSARLVGAGDIATSGSMDTATGDLIDARTNARVFTAGDNAYPDGTASDFTNKYHSAWGPLKNRTSPSPGNHEYHTSGASGYKNYFGSVAGLRSVNPTYYAYTLGAWRVYALDSNISMAVGSPQYNFVQNDLAANGALCELAYWHHPIASSGQHGNIATARPIFALFDAQGGDLVLNGHDHNYERFTKINSLGQVSASGVRQIIVGTGGTSLRGVGFVQPGSEVRNFNTHGIVDINLSSTGYSGTFVPVPGKSFTDSFSGTCGST